MNAIEKLKELEAKATLHCPDVSVEDAWDNHVEFGIALANVGPELIALLEASIAVDLNHDLVHVVNAHYQDPGHFQVGIDCKPECRGCALIRALAAFMAKASEVLK